MRKILLLCLLVLAACSKPDEAGAPAAMTVGEARALNDAAAMLDTRPDPHESIAPSEGAHDNQVPSSRAETR